MSGLSTSMSSISIPQLDGGYDQDEDYTAEEDEEEEEESVSSSEESLSEEDEEEDSEDEEEGDHDGERRGRRKRVETEETTKPKRNSERLLRKRLKRKEEKRKTRGIKRKYGEEDKEKPEEEGEESNNKSGSTPLPVKRKRGRPPKNPGNKIQGSQQQDKRKSTSGTVLTLPSVLKDQPSSATSKNEDGGERLHCAKCDKMFENGEALKKHRYWCDSSRMTRSKMSGDFKQKMAKKRAKVMTPEKRQQAVQSNNDMASSSTPSASRKRGRPPKVSTSATRGRGRPPKSKSLPEHNENGFGPENENVEEDNNDEIIGSASFMNDDFEQNVPVVCPKCKMRYRNVLALQKHMPACSDASSSASEEEELEEELNAVEEPYLEEQDEENEEEEEEFMEDEEMEQELPYPLEIPAEIDQINNTGSTNEIAPQDAITKSSEYQPQLLQPCTSSNISLPYSSANIPQPQTVVQGHHHQQTVSSHSSELLQPLRLRYPAVAVNQFTNPEQPSFSHVPRAPSHSVQMVQESNVQHRLQTSSIPLHHQELTTVTLQDTTTGQLYRVTVPLPVSQHQNSQSTMPPSPYLSSGSDQRSLQVSHSSYSQLDVNKNMMTNQDQLHPGPQQHPVSHPQQQQMAVPSQPPQPQPQSQQVQVPQMQQGFPLSMSQQTAQCLQLPGLNHYQNQMLQQQLLMQQQLLQQFPTNPSPGQLSAHALQAQNRVIPPPTPPLQAQGAHGIDPVSFGSMAFSQPGPSPSPILGSHMTASSYSQVTQELHRNPNNSQSPFLQMQQQLPMKQLSSENQIGIPNAMRQQQISDASLQQIRVAQQHSLIAQQQQQQQQAFINQQHQFQYSQFVQQQLLKQGMNAPLQQQNILGHLHAQSQIPIMSAYNTSMMGGIHPLTRVRSPFTVDPSSYGVQMAPKSSPQPSFSPSPQLVDNKLRFPYQNAPEQFLQHQPETHYQQQASEVMRVQSASTLEQNHPQKPPYPTPSQEPAVSQTPTQAVVPEAPRQGVAYAPNVQIQHAVYVQQPQIQQPHNKGTSNNILDKYRKLLPQGFRPIEPKPVVPNNDASKSQDVAADKQQTFVQQFTINNQILAEEPLLQQSVIPSLRKNPVLTAVVRPMEHPLQKMSHQISQLESSFNIPSVSLPPVPTGPNAVINGNNAMISPPSPTTPQRPVKKKPSKPSVTTSPAKPIKVTLQRTERGNSYSVKDVSEAGDAEGKFRSLKISSKVTSGGLKGTTTDVVVEPKVHIIPVADPENDDLDANITISESGDGDGAAVVPSIPVTVCAEPEAQPKLAYRAVVVYEILRQSVVIFRSSDVRAIWNQIFENAQGIRQSRNLPPLSYPSTTLPLVSQEISTHGLRHRAVQFLLKHLPKKNKETPFKEPPPDKDTDEVKINESGCARTEGFAGRKKWDMFGWLASKHRNPLEKIPSSEDVYGKSIGMLNLQRHRQLKEKIVTKNYVVMCSTINGRGLYTRKDIDAGDFVIEYTGEVIRSFLCDQREKYYETKGIGCYMFRINEDYVLDATMKGNLGRFINHSCEPNCRTSYERTGGCERIVIYALRKIKAGEELTYDYKFEREENLRIPCSCGTKKCRKYLN